MCFVVELCVIAITLCVPIDNNHLNNRHSIKINIETTLIEKLLHCALHSSEQSYTRHAKTRSATMQCIYNVEIIEMLVMQWENCIEGLRSRQRNNMEYLFQEIKFCRSFLCCLHIHYSFCNL